MKIKVYNLSDTEKIESSNKIKEAEITYKAAWAAEKINKESSFESRPVSEKSITEKAKEISNLLPESEHKKSEVIFYLPKAKPEKIEDNFNSLQVAPNSEEPHKVTDIRSKSFIIEKNEEPIFTTEILSESDENSIGAQNSESYIDIPDYHYKKRRRKNFIATFLLLSFLTFAVLLTFYGLLKQKVYPPKAVSDFMVAFYEDDISKVLPKFLLMFSGFQNSSDIAGNSYLYNQKVDDIMKQTDVSGKDAENDEEYKNDGENTTEVLSDTQQVSADGIKKYPLTESDLSRGSDKIYINNETNYPVNIENVLKSDYPSELKTIPNGAVAPTFSSVEPVVLILHTHGTESYAPEDSDYYSPETAPRSKNTNENVISVGTELTKTLERYGIPTIHCEIMHDEVSYINAYSNSLKTANEYLEKYPSIKYVIDIHRDSIIRDTGEKIKPHTVIAGEECAQLMFVIGSSGGGAYHPNWQENLNTAVKLQNEVNTEYPTLMRPINIRNSRFNQQVKAGAFILEVGSCGNTLEEAKNAIRLFGKCFAKTISEN